MSKILVVEDDETIRNGIEELLAEAGYEVESVSALSEARRCRSSYAERQEGFSLYLLDLMLGKESGFSLCREIRSEEETPIIFLSAFDEEEHVIEGLNLGADDYIGKPFRRKELLARVAAHIRRGKKDEEKDVILSGELVYRKKEGRVFRSGEELELRKLERELLLYFLQSNGRLLKREQILAYIWDSGEEYVEDNTLSVWISRLRKKLGKYDGEDYIETIRGIGYRWKQKIIRREKIN